MNKPTIAIQWHHIYFFGIKLGIMCIKASNIRLGLHSICNPIRSGFCRYIEIPYVVNALQPQRTDNILDVASPKHTALFINTQFSSNVTAIDIMTEFIEPYAIYGRCLGADKIVWKVKDARCLDCKNDSFDKVYSVSVLEHIPDEGDILAMQEISRVLKSGGICAITVPFSSKYKELYKDANVYERKHEGKPVFFQRFYDDKALKERLLMPSGLREINRTYYCERFGIERLWNKLPRLVYMPLHFMGPLFAYLAYKKINITNTTKTPFSGFCCITLKKE